jgi:hypothetical protein
VEVLFVPTAAPCLKIAASCPPAAHKRPQSSYLRFAAEQPNERWQLDITHWTLSEGTDVEILNLLVKS